jgi:hypothetical protein
VFPTVKDGGFHVRSIPARNFRRKNVFVFPQSGSINAPRLTEYLGDRWSEWWQSVDTLEI